MKNALMLLVFSFCLSCGIKGPPLPPADENLARKQKAESITVLNSADQGANAASTDTTKANSNVKSKKQKK